MVLQARRTDQSHLWEFVCGLKTKQDQYVRLKHLLHENAP